MTAAIIPLPNPAKKRIATYAIMQLRKAGLWNPQPCSKCGCLENPHLHHPDYNQPLLAVWLCARCHAQEHAGQVEPKPISRQRRQQMRYVLAGLCQNCGGEKPESSRTLCERCARVKRDCGRRRLGIDPVAADQMHAVAVLKRVSVANVSVAAQARYACGSLQYQNLLRLCNLAGLNRYQLGVRSGLSASYYQRLRYDGVASLRILTAISPVFNLTLESLAVELNEPLPTVHPAITPEAAK